MLAAALAAPASLIQAKETPSMFNELLEASMKDKKGITLYVRGGQSVVGVVVKINGDHVEMRSREFSRILVRLEAIDGAALS